jgi:hypothetical protein
VSSETFQEYYLDNKLDIKDLIYYIGINAKEFDFQTTLDKAVQPAK